MNDQYNTYDFVVTLKRNGEKGINIVSQILLAIFLFAFIGYVLGNGLNGSGLWLLIIPIMIIVLWALGYVRAANPEFKVYYRVELLIAAMGWVMLPLMSYSLLIGCVYILLAIAERVAKRPLQFCFTKENVELNNIPKKIYEWYEIDNAMIRDNIFTLDLRNNKILQRPLDSPIDAETLIEFNAYCKQQLHFTEVPKPISNPQ